MVLLVRKFRHHRQLLLENSSFRTLLKTYNAVTRSSSGKPLSTVGLLTHVGRHSGRSYQTSVGVNAYGDGFLVPLTYGPTTDWCRNLVAAGGGALTWKGQTYQLERPEIVSGAEPLRSWPMRTRIMLQLAGIDEFVWLHKSQSQFQMKP